MRPRKVPQRMCLGCGEMKSKRELIRVVRTPDGEILVDHTGKKAGRGAYVCHNLSCLEIVIKNRKLEKALKQAISSEIYERIRQDFGDISAG